jgi:hypothetical protein
LGVNYYENDTNRRLMNPNLNQRGRLHGFLEDSRAWRRAILLALQIYGVAALSYIWFCIHYGTPGMLRPMGAPILDAALLLGYVLCASALSVVGFKQLRCGARRRGFVNVGFAALTVLLGWCAWYLLQLEAGRWL